MTIDYKLNKIIFNHNKNTIFLKTQTGASPIFDSNSGDDVFDISDIVLIEYIYLLPSDQEHVHF